MNEPLVTVAIAAYNVEKFLLLGMQYVRNQTYQNLDILLVDDGSTDRTPQLCDELAQTDRRIRVVHKPNGGLGSARNVGIEQARGDFLYFFDVDDSIEPTLIEENVHLMQEKAADLVMFGFYVRNDGEQEEEAILLQEHTIVSNEDFRRVYIEELSQVKHGNGFAWNKFYCVDFLRQHGFRFGSQRIQQDEPFNLQLYPKLERVYINPKAYYHYVIYTKGNNRSHFIPDRFDIITQVYHQMMDFCATWNIADERILQQIQQRYTSGIYQTVTANIGYPDCDLGFLQKVQYVKQILSKPQVRKCIEEDIGRRCCDPLQYCILHGYATGVVLLYKLKSFLKKLLRA